MSLEDVVPTRAEVKAWLIEAKNQKKERVSFLREKALARAEERSGRDLPVVPGGPRKGESGQLEDSWVDKVAKDLDSYGV